MFAPVPKYGSNELTICWDTITTCSRAGTGSPKKGDGSTPITSSRMEVINPLTDSRRVLVASSLFKAPLRELLSASNDAVSIVLITTCPIERRIFSAAPS